jgi:hypothetical protein
MLVQVRQQASAWKRTLSVLPSCLWITLWRQAKSAHAMERSQAF